MTAPALAAAAAARKAFSNSLDELIIGDPSRLPGHDHDMRWLDGQPILDILDANNEDPLGRMPWEPGYGCAPVPELIPAWVLADALELQAAGYTLRKIATAVLPVTGCPDVPSCEEILAARLAGGTARPVA